MITLSKQETCITFNLEKNQLIGRTRIQSTLQDSSKISLYCKQLEILKIWAMQGTVSYSYPCPQIQSQWLSYSLNNTKSTNDLLEMMWEIWDYEVQQGGFLVITFPFSRGDITIYIDYILENPVAGIRFYNHLSQKIVAAENLHECKRYFMPCLDGLHHKYPLFLEFKVPEDYYVVCSGDIIGIITEDNTKCFQYFINTYISTIGFCIAPITNIIQDPNNSIVTHFSMKHEKELMYTINNQKFSYGNMLRGFSEKFGKPFPFKTQKVVFLPSFGKTSRFSGLSILDEKYLINERMHELFIETVRELVASATYNWLECFHRVISWADYWLIYGLQEYFARSFIGEVMDLNELKFIIEKEVKVYCEYVEKGLELRP